MGTPAGGQSYRERRPAPALAGVVSAAWVQHVAPGAPPFTDRTVPNGSVELVVRVGSVPQLVGPLTRPRVEVLEPGSTLVGVRFEPGAAAALLGLPAAELVDVSPAADEVWGRSAVELGERVAGAASTEAALRVLEEHVAGRLADGAGPDPLVREAVRQLMPWRADSIGSLTSSLHISERQLRRRLRSAVGLAPKVLHRMLRFQGFLALLQLAVAQGRMPGEDRLALLAAEAGYADQAHLTRECLRLTGMTPRAFLADMERHCLGGHDHAASFTPLLAVRASY